MYEEAANPESAKDSGRYPSRIRSTGLGHICFAIRPSVAEPGLVRRRDLLPMRRGFLYLVAIMDWFSRNVLAWRLSNTMDADFCVTARPADHARAVLQETSFRPDGPNPRNIPTTYNLKHKIILA